jgi:hypothetical protein
MTAIMELEIEPPQSTVTELAERIDAIEEAYEFMLAYAAQGRRDERGTPGPGIRHFLSRIDMALGPLPDCAAAACRKRGAKDCDGIVGLLAEDARKAQMLVRFALGRATIGSQLIDNLNASIHLRALLTDLFVLDEALKVAATADRA